MIQYKNRHLTVFQSSLYMTTSAVLCTNDAVIVTDPNWLPLEIEEIKQYVMNNFGNKQLYIIYTHSDFDHIIGAGAFPGTMAIASEAFYNNPYKDEVLQTIHQFDQKYYVNRNYKPEYPTADIVVVQDGQRLELGEITVTFYKAPGHTNDSLFSVIEPYGIFLAGDYLSDVEFPFITGSYKDYISTIHKAEKILNKHHIKTLVPGHGTTTDNKQEMIERIKLTKYYLEQLPYDQGEMESLLRKEYKFYEGMKEIHSENKLKAKEELI